MAIVNVTPDSFSDGGRHDDPAAAVSHAMTLLAQGADMLDIGGESTRPGAEPVSEAEELARILPVIGALRPQTSALISVDTYKPSVARAAIAAGADVWNDVSALQSPGAVHVAAGLGCQVVLMHMQGDPQTMQQSPRYADVVDEVADFLLARAQAAMAAGVARDRIWIDPGIGFGKTPAHNLALLAHLDRFVALGFPVLLGASRKGLIQTLDPLAKAPADRLGGSLAAALAGARSGVAAVRVHDVRETVQALKVWSAIDGARVSPAL
ncbi:MAG: dihydropteroate synthase [Alphaproteobacteria bacterium PA2]|nr:MAG: dihydropteroate synthase [Alphaproteobacteria bacterium PA2]